MSRAFRWHRGRCICTPTGRFVKKCLCSRPAYLQMYDTDASGTLEEAEVIEGLMAAGEGGTKG